MSLALIQESAKETRRLAIAGSPLAVGDFRLKKLATSLEQAGAKVPVFAQVAKAINDLVNGNEAESSANLLNLSTLLNAILYTQGQSGADGDYREFEGFPTNCSSTRTSARILKPIVQALTSTGGGRLEVIRTAWERGAFNDLRLIDPAIYALGDNFPELADLVAEKILPAYGPGIVPRLKASLDLKGKKEHARRLTLAHQVDPVGTLELCKTALETGSPEVKAATIACLGQHEECLPLVMDQANSKNKTLRAAALEALAPHDQPEIIKLFTTLISGKTLDVLARPLRRIRNRQVLNSLLSEGKRLFDLLLKGENEQMPRMWEVLNCLEGRTDAETEEFIIGCFNQFEKLSKATPKNGVSVSSAEFTTRLASLLCQIGSRRAVQSVLAKRATLPVEAFPQLFQSALAGWSADKVYQEFAHLLEHKQKSNEPRSEQILRSIIASRRDNLLAEDFVNVTQADSAPAQKLEWDPRWLGAAIKAELLMPVCCLAEPGDQAAISYLLQRTNAKNQSGGLQTMGHNGLVIRTLARCQYPKVTDVFLDLVTKRTHNAPHLDYDLHLLFASARYLPPADLPRLDEFAATVAQRFVDSYLLALAPLRPGTHPG